MSGSGSDGHTTPRSRRLMKRLLWFFALWTAGVLVVLAISYAIRFAIGV